jgi:hypothetical protein
MPTMRFSMKLPRHPTGSPILDFVLETETSHAVEDADLPQWAIELRRSIRSRLYAGYVLYGNIDDLYVEGDDFLTFESFLRRVVGQDMPCHILDPALGVLPDLRSGGDQEKVTPGTRLEEFLVEINRTMDECALVLQGADLWLGEDQGTTAFLVKRLVEASSSMQGGPVILVICRSLSGISEYIVQNSFFQKIDIPFPEAGVLRTTMEDYSRQHPGLLEGVNLEVAAERLSGVKVLPLLKMLKRATAEQQKMDLVALEGVKRSLVQETCDGLLDFIIPQRKLDDLYGLTKLKKVIRRDLALWEGGEKHLMPKGYLLLGPVGIGKTYFVESLAGEAGVPVIKINNFRSGRVGETEANLEKIFRLLRSLSRCFVFVDEADQSMGSRQSGSDGSAGRVYSMFAQEISSEANRGKIIWIMATSQPHKLEPDLKRPGRMDLKIPLLPCENAEVSFNLLIELGKKRGLSFGPPEVELSQFQEKDRIMAEDKYILAAMPPYVTPASAMVIVEDVARKKLDQAKGSDRELLRLALRDHQPLIPRLVMQEQCRLAVREASDMDFVPMEFQYLQTVDKPFVVL